MPSSLATSTAAQVRSMRCRKIVDAELQTERDLSVMRCEAGGRFRRLSQG
jgi:hypothetical protein